ncbi:MAG: ABC transporter permease [Gemmatimonadales bacterium]
MTAALARARRIIAAASRLVPREERAEWLDEWHGELEALAAARGADRAARVPSPVGFAAGAVRHALWQRFRHWSLAGLGADLRSATRALRRAPGFTLAASLTLALGIAANGLIFSLVNGLLRRPPGGIPAPEEVVRIGRSYDDAPRWDSWSLPAIRSIAEDRGTFRSVAGYTAAPLVLGAGTETESVPGHIVTGRYFDVLGVRPFLGRLIAEADDREGLPVAVLSYGLWNRRFAANARIVGTSITIGNRPYQVIGVASPEFSGPDAIGTPPSLWLPVGELIQRPETRSSLADWGTSWLDGVGRLAPDVSLERARTAMGVMTDRLRTLLPEQPSIRILLSAGVGLDPESRAEAQQTSLLLTGVVGLVLLLACLSVANLLLARSAARTGELGVRMALGAGRGRLARQVMIESLVLAAFATILSLPLVAAAEQILPAVVPIPFAISLRPDARVFGALLAVGLGAGLLFGAAPAWAVASGAPSRVLRGARTTTGQPRTRIRNTLVVVQLALSVGLVAGTALLTRSVRNAHRATAGFAPDGLAATFADLESTGRYDAATGPDAAARILAAVRALPGVDGATLANQVPIAGGHSRRSVWPADQSNDRGYEAEYVAVGPDYFATMGIPIVEGRALGSSRDEPEPVVVVSRALVRLFWPDRQAVGRILGSGRGTVRVVGVAGDVNFRSLQAEPRPAVFYPLHQAWTPRLAVVIRSRGAARELADPLTRAVADVDPALPLSRVFGFRSALDESLSETRRLGLLMAGFAVLALALATVGLYGLASFTAAWRTREFGLRMALGARPGALAGMVLLRGVALAVVGVLAGLGLAVAGGRALGRLLLGVSSADPLSLFGGAAVLFLVAVVATWMPARRAARVDPASVLRGE